MGATFAAEDWFEGCEKGKTTSKKFVEVRACSASTWFHPSGQHSCWEINSGKELVTNCKMNLRSIRITATASKPDQSQIGIQIHNSLDNTKTKIAGWSFCPSAYSQQAAAWVQTECANDQDSKQGMAWCHKVPKNNCEFDWMWLHMLKSNLQWQRRSSEYRAQFVCELIASVAKGF